MSNLKKLVSLIGVFTMFVSLVSCPAFADSTDGIYLSVEAEPTATGSLPVLVTVKLHNPTNEGLAVGSSLSAEEISGADINHDGVVNQSDIDLLRKLMDGMTAYLALDVNGDGRFDKADIDLIQAQGIDVNHDGTFNAQDVDVAHSALFALGQLISQADANRDGVVDQADADYIRSIIQKMLNSRMSVRLTFAGSVYDFYPKNSFFNAHSESLLVVTQVSSLAVNTTHQVTATLKGAVVKDMNGKIVGDVSSVAYDTFRIEASSPTRVIRR